MDDAVLTVDNLSVEITLSHRIVHASSGVSFTVRSGETLGLVGESGCGKTITGLAILRLLPPGGHVTGGAIKLGRRDLLSLSDKEMQDVRGAQIGMVFQDSAGALNPTMTIGRQIAESVRRHRTTNKAQAMNRATELLGLVGIAAPREHLDDYPHELSGGQRQRVMIAIALACEPKLLVADEPTTALDVTTQGQILSLLDDLKMKFGMAVLLITHDMGVVAGRADRVTVMYAGQVIETAPTAELFSRMRHQYTKALLGSIPQLSQDRAQPLSSIPGLPPDLATTPQGCRFAPRCNAASAKCREDDPVLQYKNTRHLYACWHPCDGPSEVVPKLYREPGADVVVRSARRPGMPPESDNQLGIPGQDGSAPDGGKLLEAVDVVREYATHGGPVLRRSAATVKAVSGISFSVRPGETFGLVGESGCGKTTLGKLVVGLEKPDAGRLTLNGTDFSTLSTGEFRRFRRDLQMMFQDPLASLDPRMRVGATLRQPMAIQHVGTRHQQNAVIHDLLGEVGLPASASEHFPHEFSGGQRQRIGLARALTLTPKVIVADEPVSALDVSIRSQVLNLMKRLQEDHRLTYLLISHDLAVVKYLSDRIGVMYLGKLVEVGSSEDIYRHPAHHYTAGLITAIPVPDPTVEKNKTTAAIRGELPSTISPPSGCRFRTRCPAAQQLCAEREPELRTFHPGHVAACHFPLVSPSGV